MKPTINWLQIGAWQGGTVSSVVLSPHFATDGIALAATSAGIFRTASRSQQGSLAMDGFGDPSALALACGQSAEGTVFFATSEQGRLFRSQDLGQSWSEIESWAGLGVGAAMVVSPDFAQDHTLFVATAQGIFRTLDAGITWQEAAFGLLDLDTICLAMAPDFAHSQTLWAGTALGGLFRTRNAGRAWRESGEGLPDCAVQSIVLSPNFAQDQTLFAGMETGGVYRSGDGGRSWEMVGEALAEIGVNALATFVSPTTLFGYVLLAGTSTGIYASHDGGEQWAIELADLPILDLAMNENGAGLAALYQQGIFIRNPEDGSWQPAATDIVAHAPPQMLQSSKGLLLALDDEGALAFLDTSGADASGADASGADASGADASDADASHNVTVEWQALLSTDENSPTVAIGYASFDGEERFYAASVANVYCMPSKQGEWHLLPAPPLSDEDSIVQLVVCERAEGVNIALGTALGNVLWLDNAHQQWRELAHPWRNVALLSLFFASDVQGKLQLYTLTAAENDQENYVIDLLRYDDTWSSLATFESESPAVLTLAADSAIFLATQHRLIKLFSQGENGELTVTQYFFAEDTRITALAQSPDGVALYVATTAALHRSTDGGVTWDEVSALPTTQPVVAIFPKAGKRGFVVGTLGGRLWTMDGL